MLSNGVIYEPRGKAREYCRLAVNLYSGCSHGCIYCYAPNAVHKTRQEFKQARPRLGIIDKLTIEAARLRFDKPDCPILLCFTCDPYQPSEATFRITRQAIEILKSNRLNVEILTKGDGIVSRDFDLYGKEDWFGVTLTCDNAEDSVKWEPIAAVPRQRIENLRTAHDKGIKTWVSLEPVLYPEQTLNLIDMTHEFVDEFKVGVLNYHPLRLTINWADFGRRAIDKLESLGCRYYLKDDLRRKL